MTHEVYTLSRQELERLLAEMCYRIADGEDFSRMRAEQWATIHTPIVLAGIGVRK